MKIEVEEYVRTNEGIIDQVIIDYNGKCNNSNCNGKHVSCKINYYNEGDIVKHSKNIIDLIEVGDYVNGYRILEKTKIKNGEMQICILKDNNISNWRTINDKTLKTIVTHEQFESIEYKVEEE